MDQLLGVNGSVCQSNNLRDKRNHNQYKKRKRRSGSHRLVIRRRTLGVHTSHTEHRKQSSRDYSKRELQFKALTYLESLNTLLVKSTQPASSLLVSRKRNAATVSFKFGLL